MLKEQYDRLRTTLTSVPQLADCLYSKNCLSDSQRQLLCSELTSNMAAQLLVDYLIQQSRDTYNFFLIGLLETNQPHLHLLLTGEG